MTNLEAYKIWAPEQVLWTQWAKPVIFAQSPDMSPPLPELNPPPAWMTAADPAAIIIVDMLGPKSVIEGMALAGAGYRPVPLYNCVCGKSPNQRSAINVYNLRESLFAYAPILANMPLPMDAPPVFLLDSRRMNGQAKDPGRLDNRWCVFPQDMPSAQFLLEHGIRRVYLRHFTLQNDLAHILQRYRLAGIEIYGVGRSQKPAQMGHVAPSLFKSLSYRYRTVLKLSRNPAGGFGIKIPEATTTAHGGRYYRIG